MQQYIVDPVKWALDSTYHTTLEATPGQLAFGRDMKMPTSYIANWHLIRSKRQQQPNKNTIHENDNRIPHHCNIGDKAYLTASLVSSPNKRIDHSPSQKTKVNSSTAQS
jgi:hypothetical protein